jgi:hypothetical protein
LNVLYSAALLLLLLPQRASAFIAFTCGARASMNATHPSHP